MKRIAEEQGVHYGTVRNYIESNGIEVRSTREQMKLDFPPKEFPQTAECSAFFDGLLLGDGSIPRRKGGCHNIYSQGCKHREYLEYVSKRASVYCVSFSPINARWVSDSRCKNGGYFTNNLQSHSYRTFHDFRLRWYPEGSKRIPRDLRLTRDVLLQAYLSDGSYYKEVFICTNGFTVPDVGFLQGLIEKEVGITTRIRLDAGKPVIVIRKSDAPAFFSYIGPSPVKCYEYKWVDGRTDKKRLADNLRARQKYLEERMKVS
jgi:hypothetical protein